MIKITSKQLNNLSEFQDSVLSKKIELWLDQEDPALLKKSEVIDKKTIISMIVKKARKSGMLVETDYALFVYIVLSQPKKIDLFFQLNKIKALLSNDKINPAGKLVRMEQLSKESMQRSPTSE